MSGYSRYDGLKLYKLFPIKLQREDDEKANIAWQILSPGVLNIEEWRDVEAKLQYLQK